MSISQKQFGYGTQAPNGSLPLSYVYIPTPTISQNLSLIGSGKYVVENQDSLSAKGTYPVVNITESNILNTFISSGIITKNLVVDPSFLYGVSSPFWSVVSGMWSVSGGRTANNSFFETGRDPAIEQGLVAQNPCASVSWSSTGSIYEIESNYVLARAASGEGQFNIENVLYELSLWIASDPVDSIQNRHDSASSKVISVTDNNISVLVIGYNASGGFTEVLSSSVLSYSDINSKDYFTQGYKLFKLFRAPYFQISNINTVSFQITIMGNNTKGMYFDDVRLRSYLYGQNTSISNFSMQSSGSINNTTITSGPNLIPNPTFIDTNYVNGDFNSVSNNFIADPSFELGKWTTTNYGIIWHGEARTGNNFLDLTDSPLYGAEVDTAYYDITGLSNSEGYIFGGWYKAYSMSGGVSTTQLEIQLFDSGSSLLGSIYGELLTPSYSSSYANYSFTWCSSGYPTTVKWRVVVNGNIDGPFIAWDDMYITSITMPLAPWTFLPSQSLGNAGNPGVLAYEQVNNAFEFDEIPGNHSHYVYPTLNIYKNATYSFTTGFAEQYFNTTQVAISDYINVIPTDIYDISFNLRWINSTGNVRASFSEPFSVNNNPSDVFYGYGALLITVTGFDVSNTITETITTWGQGSVPYYTVSPEFSNLPTVTFYDASTGWNYAPIVLPKFSFAIPSTVSAKVQFNFIGTTVGIDTIVFQTLTATPSGYSPEFTNITAYNLSSSITVDSMSLDQTDAWRLGIKDGIFEKQYIVSSSEPSGSWLLQSGFNIGDDITLIYTLPEYNLGVQWIDPNNTNNIQHYQEVYKQVCTSLDNNTISLGYQNIIYITQILINGTVIITGTTNGIIPLSNIPIEYSSIVSSINANNGTITFVNSINDNDVIEASYIYLSSRYIYRGYYDNDTWYDLDLNPSAGHRWHFCKDSFGKAGYDLVNNTVTMYLLPTAAYYTSGNISGNYNYKTAFDLSSILRPSSFLRHSIGTTLVEETVPWYPSATVIGKVFITPQGSIDDIRLTDIRSRGGGLSQDYVFGGNNQPSDFTEETRIQVAVADNDWLNSGVFIYPNDVVTIFGYGWASGSPSGNPYTILPSNSLWASISATTPTSGSSGTIFIGSYFTAGVVSTVISSSQAPSGILFFKVINENKGLSGELFVVIRVKRKFQLGWVWDYGTFDGLPTMINGVTSVSIPKEVLNQFTTQQVEAIVNKNIAAGCVAIINYF